MPDFTFRRSERLKSRKVIEQLFKGGQSFAQYPLRIVWMEVAQAQSAFPAQFALSVSKKKFKRAVDRNRVRRLVREAYRLHKHSLYGGIAKEGGSAHRESPQIALMIIYTGTEILPFAAIEKAMRALLGRFVKKYGASNQNHGSETL